MLLSVALAALSSPAWALPFFESCGIHRRVEARGLRALMAMCTVGLGWCGHSGTPKQALGAPWALLWCHQGDHASLHGWATQDKSKSTLTRHTDQDRRDQVLVRPEERVAFTPGWWGEPRRLFLPPPEVTTHTTQTLTKSAQSILKVKESWFSF